MKLEALGLCCALMLGGCTTIPKDAPRDFFAARAALDRADKERVDEVLPQTIKRAEQKFDEGLELLGEAGDGAGTKPLAVAKAAESLQLAERAIELNADVRGWDKNIEGYVAMKHRPQDAEVVLTEPSEGLPGVVTLPVAFFEPSDDAPHARDGTIKSLINMLDQNESVAVRLIGHADYRGGEAFNHVLGQRRAEAMALELEDAGIPRDRIEVVSAGSDNATPTKDEGALQLDRRVDVEIIDMAH